LDPASIDEDGVAAYLSSAGLPDPDLFIRTGGEQRLSNFLLWQSAYAELYFTDIMWPDFDAKAYAEAIAEFSRRQRRFGQTSEQVAGEGVQDPALERIPALAPKLPWAGD
jgi:undecaprenyl diphosphate synthase